MIFTFLFLAGKAVLFFLEDVHPAGAGRVWGGRRETCPPPPSESFCTRPNARTGGPWAVFIQHTAVGPPPRRVRAFPSLLPHTHLFSLLQAPPLSR